MKCQESFEYGFVRVTDNSNPKPPQGKLTRVRLSLGHKKFYQLLITVVSKFVVWSRDRQICDTHRHHQEQHTRFLIRDGVAG